MTFAYSARHADEYFDHGYTILRGLLPATLLGELRRQSETARDLARRIDGPQAQRLQPVYEYEEIDARPFREFNALPGLVETVRQVLGPDHQPTGLTALLFEPAERPWATHWHRDWAYNVPGIDLDRFFEHIKNKKVLNQLNCALYDDASLWFVPGSDARPDSDAERAAFATIPPPPPAVSDSMSLEEAELTCAAYARSMPGAVQVPLAAGDLVFYRSSAWHLGNYVPYHRRATLHDGFYAEADWAWRKEAEEMRDRAMART
jgi:hypothetical protein